MGVLLVQFFHAWHFSYKAIGHFSTSMTRYGGMPLTDCGTNRHWCARSSITQGVHQTFLV